MNKIFKVIWSHTSQSLVVVSELTKSNGKSASSTDERRSPIKSLLALSTAGSAVIGSGMLGSVAIGTGVLATGMVMEPAYAAMTVCGTGASGISSAANATNATVIGYQAKVGSDAVAVGGHANASGGESVTVGNRSSASGYLATALGSNAKAAGASGTALGTSANASGNQSTAIGGDAKASGYASVAIGADDIDGAKTTYITLDGKRVNLTTAYTMFTGDTLISTHANGTTSEYRATTASGVAAVAIGSYAQATGNLSTVIGTNATASDLASMAIGVGARASKSSAFAMGTGAIANGSKAIAIGTNVTVVGNVSVAIGADANVSGTHSVALGQASNVTGFLANALGSTSYAGANYATAVGTGATARGIGSFAAGNLSLASGLNSTAIGSYSTANVTNAIAIGTNATASLVDSVSLGSNATTTAAVATNTATVNGLTYSGFAGNQTTSVVSVGSATQKRQIQNVAAGQISATSTDAINGSQLYATQQTLGNVATSLKTILGGNANVPATGSLTMTNIGNTGKNTVHDAIAAVKENVVAGKNTQVTSAVASNGSTTYTVDAWNTTLTNGSAEVSVTSTTNNTNKVLAYTVDLSTSAKNNITTANVTAHNANSTANTANNTANTANTTANNANNTANTANNTANNANTTANTANNTANTALTEVRKGWNLTTKANGGTATNSSEEQINMGELVTLEAGANINLTQKGANITIATSDKPTFNTVTTQNFTVQNGGNVDMGGNIVSNVGTAVNGTDAVNYDLLNKTVKAASSSVVAGSNANVASKTDANGTVYTVNAYNTTVSSGSEVTVTGTFDAKNNTTNYVVDLSAQTKQNITTANTTAHNANATANTANNTANTANTTANNANATVNKGWNITTAKTGTGNAENTTNTNVKMGDKVVITAGDNVNISQNGSNITIATSKTPTFINVTVGDTKITHEGLTINNGPSITNNGINAGNHTITNVANGTNATDAVNLQQLNASKVAVIAGLNTAVSTKANTTTGGTDYTVDAWNTTAQGAADITVTETVEANTKSIKYAIDLSQSAKTNITTANATANLANSTANTANATVNKGWNLTANKAEAGKANIQMGDTVDFSQGDNIVVTQDGKGIKIATSLTPTFTNMTTTNLAVTNGGIVNMGGNTVQNVANGTNATDAVNLQQLNASRTFVAAGTNANVTSSVGADGATTYTLNAWNTTAKGSNDIKVTNVTNAAGRVIDYTVDLSDSAKNNITTANNTAHAANATVNKGWNITTSKSAGNATDISVSNVKMGDTVTIDAGKNINITQNGSTISIATSTTPTFTTVTTGNTTINDNGLTINNGPSITNNGIDAGNKTITNVANGTNGTDAVNLNQLNEVKAATTTTVTSKDNSVNVTESLTNGRVYDLSIAQSDVVINPNGTTTNNKTGNTFVTGDNLVNVLNNTSFNVTSGNVSSGVVSGTTAEQVKAGETVTFKAGDNLVLAQSGQNFTYSLVNNLNLTDKGSITIGNTTVKDNSVSVGNVTVTDKGIDLANTTISNVANGTNATDAVNLQQLNASRTFVAAGTNANVTSVSNETGTYYTVNAWNTTAKGSDDIKVTNVTNAEGRVIDYTIDLSESAKNNITTANNTAHAANATVNKGWNITTSASNGSVSGSNLTNVNMGETVTIDAGKNINITQANGTISIATSDKPTFVTAVVGNTSLNGDDIKLGNTTINGNGLTINNGPSITNNGINAGNQTITNVANGVNGTDAVNVQQLTNATTNLTSAGLNFVGNNVSGVIHTNLGDTLSIVGELAETVVASAQNIRVDSVDGKLVVKLSESPTFTNVTTGSTTINNNGLTINNGPSITTSGINAANTTISNVKDGEVSAISKDAVNGSQLYATNQNVTNVTNTVTKGWNITTTKSAGEVSGSNLTNVKMGDTVTIDAGKNINITQENGKISIATSDKPTFVTATVGNTSLSGDDIKLGNTTIDGNGLTINNGPSITNNGINAGDKVITNVANGVNGTDAVNVQQLTNATTNLTNAGLNFVGNNVSGVIHKNLSETLSIVGELADDAAASAKNVRVDTENGKLVIKLSENPTFTTVTTGNTSLSDNGLTINNGPSITNNGIDAGNKVITNVSAGTNGTDAVNLDQLNKTAAAAKTELSNGSTTTVNTTQGANGQTIYTVEVNKAPVTINSTTGVAETNTTGDVNNSFATVGDVVNALNNVSWTIQGNGVEADKVTAGNQVNFVNGNGTTAQVSANKEGTQTNVTFNVNKSGLTVSKDGNGNVTVTANTAGDTFATAEEVAKAITDSELTSTVVSGNDNLVVTNVTEGNNTEFKVTLSNNLNLTENGSVTIGNTTLNNNGLTVGNTSVTADGVKVGNVTINNNGINAGSTQITNVANGTNATDAVNLSQLNATAAAAKTELSNGSTTTVNASQGANGQTIYTVEVNKAPVTINSTTGVAETNTTGDVNNSFTTVGDVVNALNNVSWTIQGNGDNVDKVTAGNQVNFVNGNGTTAQVSANKEGTQTNVTFNVNMTTATITDGKANVANGDSFLNATTVANLVNNSSWSVGAGTVAGSNGRSDYVANANSSISAGEQVNYQAGQNIVIGGEGNNVTIATNPNSTFDAVTVNNQVTVGNTTITNDGLTINNGPSVTKSGIDAANTKIANLQDGEISATSKDAVNGSQLYATNQNVTNLTNEVAKGWNIEALTVEGSTGSATSTGKSNVAMGNTVTVKAGNNINIEQKGNEIAIATSDKPTFNTVSTNNVVLKDDSGNNVANINAVTGEDGVSEVSIAGNNVTQADGSVSNASRITNVAAGKKDTDAVNVSQLKGAVNNINNSINAVNNKVDKVDRNLRAGIAGAMAAGNLYHVTIPGKSMVAAGVGTYKGQSAVAVGYSRLSDNGKIGVKISVNSNTRGDTGAAASIGYQW
ncbi:YadA-like family protein [Actinobacillus vicugnae]|uniref:YadA-like family protein n=1 Tax=Actinobacillus vicugnae TaxID=2573093 RepID=UPI00123F2A92|nr:YadA-like family protein [Actinobacillus vicugnae]